MSSENIVLSLDNVSVHFEEASSGWNPFASPEVVRAVDGVSLEIPENEVIALVGESGCGKTTLGKTAIGLQRPTDGTVSYRGQDIWAAKERRGDVEHSYEEIRRALQIIHQDPGSSLNPNQKVISVLSAPLKRWQKHLDENDRRERIYAMLETVNMSPATDYANRYPHQLSGGEKQRIALIRALLMNPDVILADEAISALDVSLRIEMMDLFLELQERFNTSFLFISHNLSNARYLAGKADGRIGIMYLGEMVEMGPAHDIIDNSSHPYTNALQWATPSLTHIEETEDRPMRKIDIPDPIDPPSGCRFHTRCPEAREVCQSDSPEAIEVDSNERHTVSCYREYDEHEYWNSQPLTEENPEPTP